MRECMFICLYTTADMTDRNTVCGKKINLHLRKSVFFTDI